MSTSTDPPYRARVPVEHRFLGLDKRSFPYALVVVAVYLIATVVVPRIDDAIGWDDPVEPGDQIALTDEVVFTPATGWDVESGQRVGDAPQLGRSGEAKVVGAGVTFAVTADSFDGTPAALLDQIEKVTSATDDPSFEIDGDPATVTTPGGDVGVIQTYSSVNGDGLIAAFVLDGTGVKVTAYGPPAQMAAAASEIDDMIASIRRTDPGDATGGAS